MFDKKIDSTAVLGLLLSTRMSTGLSLLRQFVAKLWLCDVTVSRKMKQLLSFFLIGTILNDVLCCCPRNSSLKRSEGNGTGCLLGRKLECFCLPPFIGCGFFLNVFALFHQFHDCMKISKKKKKHQQPNYKPRPLNGRRQ